MLVNIIKFWEPSRGTHNVIIVLFVSELCYCQWILGTKCWNPRRYCLCLLASCVIEYWDPSAGTHGTIVFNLLTSYIIEFQEPSAGTHGITVFAFTYTS
jgi:hypothetical protein